MKGKRVRWGNETWRPSGKKRPLPDRVCIEKATKEYLQQGGKITKMKDGPVIREFDFGIKASTVCGSDLLLLS